LSFGRNSRKSCDVDTDDVFLDWRESETRFMFLLCCGLIWARVDRSCYTGLSETQLGEIPFLRWHHFVWIYSTYSSIFQTGGSSVWDNNTHQFKPHNFRVYCIILIYTYFLLYISCLKAIYNINTIVFIVTK